MTTLREEIAKPAYSALTPEQIADKLNTDLVDPWYNPLSGADLNLIGGEGAGNNQLQEVYDGTITVANDARRSSCIAVWHMIRRLDGTLDLNIAARITMLDRLAAVNAKLSTFVDLVKSTALIAGGAPVSHTLSDVGRDVTAAEVRTAIDRNLP